MGEGRGKRERAIKRGKGQGHNASSGPRIQGKKGKAAGTVARPGIVRAIQGVCEEIQKPGRRAFPDHPPYHKRPGREGGDPSPPIPPPPPSQPPPQMCAPSLKQCRRLVNPALASHGALGRRRGGVEN